jgi:hypothetical protein
MPVIASDSHMKIWKWRTFSIFWALEPKMGRVNPPKLRRQVLKPWDEMGLVLRQTHLKIP